MEIEKCAKCGVVLNEDEDNMTISFCCQCDEMYHGENMFDEDYDDEFDGFDSCPKCGRDYDEIDKEYQSCSKCGWDEDKKTWGEKREPTDEDYMNGDADILTGRWL
jgi:ribosomal protein L37E